MKKLRILLVTVILCMLSCVAVLAEDNSFDLSDVGIKVQIPDYLMAFTQETGISERILDATGLTEDYVLSNMKQNNQYLRAYDANNSFEINIKCQDSDSTPFADMEDEAIINYTKEGLGGFLDEIDIKIIGNSVFAENGRKYAYARYSIGDAKEGYVYSTVINGKIYYFDLRMTSGKIPDNCSALIKYIAGQTEFLDNNANAGNNEGAGVTEGNASGGAAAEDNASDNGDKGEGINIIAIIINVARIAILAAMVVVAAIVIHMFLDLRKKNKDVINVSTRRTVAYEDRLKRIMADSGMPAQPASQEQNTAQEQPEPEQETEELESGE